MPAFRALFLDAGGTLVHVNRRVIQECLTAYDIRCDDATLRAALAASLDRLVAAASAPERGTDASRAAVFWSTFFSHFQSPPAAAEQALQRIRGKDAEGHLWSYVQPGTLDALLELKRRGYVLGVVSNADGRVEEVLRRACLREALDFVIDSTVVGVEKPDPRIFHIACERAGVRPAEALHVGDIYEIDVLGARAAGVTPLLVGPAHRHAGRDCDWVRDVLQLPAWLAARDPRPAPARPRRTARA